jgi:hypothetical protein
MAKDMISILDASTFLGLEPNGAELASNSVLPEAIGSSG